MTIGVDMGGTTKVKAATPRTVDEVNEAIAKIGEKRRAVAELEVDMNRRIAALRADFEAAGLPLRAEIEALAAGVECFCDAKRDALARDGGKSIRFAAGEVVWKMSTPKVVLDPEMDLDKLIASFERRGLERFIRVKKELNKQAIVAEPDAIARTAGIAIEQSETFNIRPHDHRLEAVTA
jgi:phage host-nuclease inhibitor protein Gam